jgi:transposase
MDHVAIDIGGKESQICVRASGGAIVLERRHRTSDLGEFFAKREPSVVVLETCAEAFELAELARAAKHQVRVVSATLVKALGVGSRGVKTDIRDARLLSEASCRMDLPSVHVPARHSRERKTICGMRDELVESRTKLINSVRGWLRATARRPRTGSSETFVKRVRALVGEAPVYVGALLAAIESLSAQIDVFDVEIARHAKSDPTCRLLMTTPGVGPITAIRFVSAIDDRARFDSAHKVESYFGLTPGERSSSESQHRTGITKAGCNKTRWCLVQAAWVAWRRRPSHPMVRWAREVEKRRGRRTALVALARKLTGVLFAMWRDGKPYDDQRGAMTIATE